MKTQKYIVTIEMPDGDMISSGWLKDLIQGDCDVEDEGRDKVSVEEVSTSEDLEEAAEKHIQKVRDAAGHPGWEWETQDVSDAFKAGAEWQAEKWDKETSKLLQAVRQTAYIYGWGDHRERMLKDAVEGFIFQSADYYPKQLIAGYDGELGMGDKVKIVIIPIKEDKK